jgi:hypothetical protein
MTQSAAMPRPTTRVNADRRRDKEIAEARPPASDPALSENKHRMCDGMSSVSAAVQIENSGAGGRLGHHQKWRRVEGVSARASLSGAVRATTSERADDYVKRSKVWFQTLLFLASSRLTFGMVWREIPATSPL